MTHYDELLKITVQDNHEPLVDLGMFIGDIVCKYEKSDMIPLVGNRILVRRGVAERLRQVYSKLNSEYPDLNLKIVYGYRAPEVQSKYFNERKLEISSTNPDIDEEQLIRRAHILTASPNVAGHPTGSSVDMTLLRDGKEVDMGTGIAEFSQGEKIQTFAKGISSTQRQNRDLLRDAMMSAGFAPFDGEWWHFSYGDRDWSLYYGYDVAIYDQILLEEIK